HCPFVLDDPDLPPPVPVAVTEQEPGLPLFSAPEMGPASSWGRIGVDDRDVLIGVGPSVGGDVATAVHIGGTSGGTRRGDGTRISEPSVLVVGFTTLVDGGDCNLVKVAVEVPLLPEDDTEDFVTADLDQAYYVDQVRSLVERVRDAVRLDPSGVAGAPGEPCATLLAAGPMPTAEGTDAEWTGTMADGRTFTMTHDEGGIEVSVEGEDLGTARLVGLGQGSWIPVGDTGILLGGRRPEAAAIGAVGPDGTIHSEGVVLSPDGTVFALPDVGASDGVEWRTAFCTAQGELISDGDLTVPLDPPGDGDPTAPADPPPATTEPATTEPPATEPTTTVAPMEQMSWEGPLVDGRTYRVEVEDGLMRAFADGVKVGMDNELPGWPGSPDDGSASGIGFELSPNPDGGPQDWILVGARPPGAVETFVESPDGVVELPSLTISPDGRFYALHGLELDFMEDPATPWPIKHRDAAGNVIELP
ncbi:MAG TPA: hypothetical protein VK507_07760, partial [Iamia sp.]|nr:hypothetical protein [Iamia sp.]